MSPPDVSYAVLLHGGTSGRRTALANGIRAAHGLDIRVRVSSRAAEAAKCLADPNVLAVFLLDEPSDGDAVRAAATQRGWAANVYALEPRDDAAIVVALLRDLLMRTAERRG